MPMNDISYQIPEMIERFKHRAKICASVVVGAVAVIALSAAL